MVSVTINPSHSKQLHHFSKKTGILTPATVAPIIMVVALSTMSGCGCLGQEAFKLTLQFHFTLKKKTWSSLEHEIKRLRIAIWRD